MNVQHRSGNSRPETCNHSRCSDNEAVAKNLCEAPVGVSSVTSHRSQAKTSAPFSFAIFIKSMRLPLWTKLALARRHRTPRYRSRLVSGSWSIPVCLVIAGCSFQYIDKEGSRHVIGLSHTIMKEARADRSEVVAQEVLTIGMSVLKLPEHSGVSIGYTKNFTIQVSSMDEAGELSFSVPNPTVFRFSDFRNIKEGLGK